MQELECAEFAISDLLPQTAAAHAGDVVVVRLSRLPEQPSGRLGYFTEAQISAGDALARCYPDRRRKSPARGSDLVGV